MQDLQNLEIFEIEVLDLLNSKKILDQLYFGGGTMMRLCHNLNRYSTDLDFWIFNNTGSTSVYKTVKDILLQNYKITDAANKKNTLLFEFRSLNIKRSLKIEIRKEQKNFDWERKIAFSKFTNKQVMIKGLTLNQMMKNKTEALISRKIIRDCFDIDFLITRGINLPKDKKTLEAILQIIDSFKDRDYKVTLGSVLDEKDRKYYAQNKFRLLREEIRHNLIAG